MWQGMITQNLYTHKLLNYMQSSRRYLFWRVRSQASIPGISHLSSYHEITIKALQRARLGVGGHLSTAPRWGNPLRVLPNGTTSKLAGLFPTLSLWCWASSREAVNSNFKVIGLTRLGIKPNFTPPKANALTTRPSELIIPTPVFKVFCMNSTLSCLFIVPYICITIFIANTDCTIFMGAIVSFRRYRNLTYRYFDEKNKLTVGLKHCLKIESSTIS